ncbi:DUF222 domain-containing protein [Gordonia jinghuaiqii]|uniref:DUF222 domain-containing protein n=2 Tax=Gordonia jinghuaiqii TaxID=2758710 RepID=A0A7D7QKH6_9ACTN|nr:DUF222 domain-containing protein [Gordonia jinghuaiqii]QMT04044.1 DUF222 domain-containing protein [Gordonia jinghuaiqii]
MQSLTAIREGESNLAWRRYTTILILLDRLYTPIPNSYVKDGFADVVTRIARESAITRYQAELWVNEAMCLRDRLPHVLESLRDGIVSRQQIQTIIARTDLIDEASRIDPDDPDSRPVIEVLDDTIADLLRTRTGSWSASRLRDMVDRLVFRHDPDAVRERRREALDKRGMWTRTLPDGTGELTAVMAAENTRIAAQAVRTLADAACPDDGRTRSQRNSDAMFALLTGTAFECHCPSDECTASIPDPDAVAAAVSTEIVIHVVTDAATLAGAPGPGWIDAHGVITDDHVRDLAARDDAVITPLTPVRTPPIRIDATTDAAPQIANLAAPTPDSGSTPDFGSTPDPGNLLIVYPGSQPADPYRPTTACAEFVRVRDGYCTEPGCTRSAFDADIDHVDEYDHLHPHLGGRTSSENLNAKCRAGHLHKTYGDWIDLQYRDDGRLTTVYVTPEGFTIPGNAETLEDLFPNLRRIRFEQAAQAPPSGPRIITPDGTTRRTTDHTAAKHARRRAERARNKQLRDANQKAPAVALQDEAGESPPPPF